MKINIFIISLFLFSFLFAYNENQIVDFSSKNGNVFKMTANDRYIATIYRSGNAFKLLLFDTKAKETLFDKGLTRNSDVIISDIEVTAKGETILLIDKVYLINKKGILINTFDIEASDIKYDNEKDRIYFIQYNVTRNCYETSYFEKSDYTKLSRLEIQRSKYHEMYNNKSGETDIVANNSTVLSYSINQTSIMFPQQNTILLVSKYPIGVSNDGKVELYEIHKNGTASRNILTTNFYFSGKQDISGTQNSYCLLKGRLEDQSERYDSFIFLNIMKKSFFRKEYPEIYKLQADIANKQILGASRNNGKLFIDIYNFQGEKIIGRQIGQNYIFKWVAQGNTFYHVSEDAIYQTNY